MGFVLEGMTEAVSWGGRGPRSQGGGGRDAQREYDRLMQHRTQARSVTKSWAQLGRAGRILIFESHNRKNGKYFAMLRQRETLPAYANRDTILDTIFSTQISVISAETGAGAFCCVALVALAVLCALPRRGLFCCHSPAPFWLPEQWAESNTHIRENDTTTGIGL